MIEDDVLSIKETRSEEKWRMISILSYVIVLIGFGVPIWWHTTKVYRASLPLAEMLQMHPIAAPPLKLEIYARTDQRSTILTQEIASLLGSTVSVALHRNKINLPVSDADDDIETAAHSIQIDAGQLVFIEWPKSGRNIVFTSRRVVFFKGEVSGYQLAMLVQKWPAVDLKTALSDPSKGAAPGDAEGVRPFPAAPNYDVLVTVVNPEPHEMRVDWDIVQAIDEHIKPYLNQLSDIANFTVKSQWLYFVDLGDNPRQVGDHWALAEQLLPHIITPLEKKLASHVSKYPCINLVIYVPSCRMAPLHIYTKSGVKSSGPVDAFISPRWGGVTIANPTCPSSSFTPDSPEIMSILTTQLTQLLGIAHLTPSSDLIQTGPKPSLWQRDHLIRARTLEYIDAARLTLRSLAQLLSEISNIVINDDVATSVQLAVDSVAQATLKLEAGDVVGALGAAQRAAVSSESAFTDPTLLALLYFPDDQKYAVYIPLFLPIMIPVIMSLRQLIQYAKHVKKPKDV